MLASRRSRADSASTDSVRRAVGHRSFSERLAARQRLWWEMPSPARRGALGEVIHRLHERRAFRSREDPDESWRCCASWPRTLVNKWNGREFAARHGCRLPTLYWSGRPLDRPPLESLPGRFVVRPVFGAGRRGVLVVAEGRELLRQEPATARDLNRKLSRLRRLPRQVSILIEELVRAEDGSDRLPTELKCHTFGDAVAAVEVLERTGVKADSCRFYTPAWEPFADPMHTGIPIGEPRVPPEGLDRMLALAANLGAEVDTYIRIDFFAGVGDCVFNEFSTVPWGGRGFTPHCNELFGALWEKKFPASI
jgi:TupA-like ATPgrasp